MESSDANGRGAVWLPDPYGGGRDVPFIPAENAVAIQREMSDEARAWRATAAAADAGAAIRSCDPMGPAVALYRDAMADLGIETVAGGVEVLVATLPPEVDGHACGTYFTVDRWCRLRRDIAAPGGPTFEAGQDAFMSLVWMPGPDAPGSAAEQKAADDVGGLLELASTVELMWWHGSGWIDSPSKSQRPALLVVIVRADTGHLGVWGMQSQAPSDTSLSPFYLRDGDIKERIRSLSQAQKRWLRSWQSIRGSDATAPELHGIISRLERDGAWLAPDNERVLRAIRDVTRLEENAPDAFTALHGEVLSLEPPLELGATTETLDAADNATAHQSLR